MIVLSVTSAILLASLQTAAANNSRTALRACLKEAVTQAKTDKVAADAFAAFANQRCGKSAASFKSALVNFDTKNKVSRRQAESDAQSQIDEFVTTAADMYTAAAPSP